MTGRWRGVVEHPLACSMLVGLVLPARAAHADFRFDRFRGIESLELIGDAGRSADGIRLVTTSPDQKGAVWTRVAQDISSGFDTDFTFRISESSDPEGDGLAWVIRGDRDTKIGGTGASIGYDLIPKSVAIEFDTYYNPTLDDPNGNHISVHTRGALPNSRLHRYSLGYATDIPRLTDGEPHRVWLHYRPPLLIVCIDDPAEPVLLAAVDLTWIPDGRAWIGFTAGTGDSFGNYEVLSWAFAELRTAIRVPEDLPTIQAAIDSAPDWGTVVVSPGTYTGDGNVELDLGGKPIHLRSSRGPESAFIECEEQSRAFDLFREETMGSIVEGFTLRRGSASGEGEGRSGGGVYCAPGTKPTFLRCTFGFCHADSHGGAVYCAPGSKPRFLACRFVGNRAGGDGGALFVDRGAEVWLANCLVSGNASFGSGGGVRALGGGTLRNCSIVDNSSGMSGGGIAVEGASREGKLTNCLLWANRPDQIRGPMEIAYSCIEGGWTGAEDIRLRPWTGNVAAAPVTDAGNLIGSGFAPFAQAHPDHPSRRGEWRIDWPVSYPAGPAPSIGVFEGR